MRKFLFWVMILTLLPCTLAAESKRVLIIGNSYTFYNRLPEMLEALSKKTANPLTVHSYTAGAMSLQGFLTMPEHAKARQLLESGEYDWVILQDQSQTPAYKPDETLSSVQKWSEIARLHKTKVLLFLTWAHATRQGRNMQPMQDMQERTSTTYCKAALNTEARVAPVGEAWAAWYQKNPGTQLHEKDCSHPTPMGTYLAACVLHASISGKALRGVPGTLKAGGRTLVSIPSATARQLQKTANASLKNFSPAAYLEQQEKTSDERPSEADIKEALKRNMSIRELIKLAGKPFLVKSNSDRKTYKFQLRDNAEMCAYCTASGIIQQISIVTPGQMADIIDLREL